MALSDYINNKYDYLALRNTTAPTVGTREKKLGLELFNEETSGEITTGVQKLAQRWLLEFLTESGSMTGLPQRGTNFMRAARTGRFRVERNVRTEFALATMRIQQILNAEEYDDMPYSERFSDAVLLNTIVIPGATVNQASGTTAVFLSLNVRIISQAGDSREVIVPITYVPRD